MSTIANDSALALADARAVAYVLLAHGFRYPDGQWFTMLNEPQRWGDWPEELDRTRPGIASRVDEVRRSVTECGTTRFDACQYGGLLRFQAAFDRLFGHTVSGKCSAYETEYGDSEISQRSAQLADLAGFYQAFGLEPAGEDGDRPDFVSVECEFMSVLSVKEAHGRVVGNDEWIERCVQAQRAFLKDHLACWLPAFAHRVGESGVDPFYSALGRLAGEIIALDCERFRLPLGPRWLALRPRDQEGETTISCLDAADCGPGSVACGPAVGSERMTPLNIDIGGAEADAAL